jgi:hypothetical protein
VKEANVKTNTYDARPIEPNRKFTDKQRENFTDKMVESSEVNARITKNSLFTSTERWWKACAQSRESFPIKKTL